ncbi:MAG: hypothetical protein DMD54_13105 [Gemmatimonadetes bacterium]|nr:MAG: hypothetical protein DMD54_13105 [Gemmatimonadota bacterium]
MRSLLILRAAVAAALVVVACGPDVTGLLPAIYPNRTDTVSVYALTGTPVSTPSAYLIVGRQVVRTDQNSSFDVAFDIDSSGHAVIMPTGAMKLGRQSGVQVTTTLFDSVKTAPSSGYQIDSAVVLSVNSVAILHSRAVQCSSDLSPVHNYFAKLHVLDIDTTSGPNGRRIQLEVLTDINCGYRGLEPGLPKH